MGICNFNSLLDEADKQQVNYSARIETFGLSKQNQDKEMYDDSSAGREQIKGEYRRQGWKSFAYSRGL